jgi:two-component system OmpR family response regulator
MNLLIVDHDADHVPGLATELGAMDHTTCLVPDGAAALQAIERDRYDAIILKPRTPLIGGEEVVRRLRERGRTLPLLVLSANGTVADKIGWLDAGADDYVVMPAATLEIEARLRALVRGRSWHGGTVETIRAGSIVVNPAQYRAWYADRMLDLTRQELNLLTALARHAGSYVTRAMLLSMVWNIDHVPGTNLVEVQIRTLRAKLTAGGEEDPILTKRGVGYMLRDGDTALDSR